MSHQHLRAPAHRRILPFWHIRLFFAYTQATKEVGTQWKIDWPKMGPSILIATALIVAIRTAKWAAKAASDPHCSDVDTELDREVSYATRITIRVMHELIKKHEGIFPGKKEPIFDGVYDEDVAE